MKILLTTVLVSTAIKKTPFKYTYQHTGAVVNPSERKYTHLRVKEDAQRSHCDDVTQKKMERKHMSAFALYQTVSADLTLPSKKSAVQVF